MNIVDVSKFTNQYMGKSLYEYNLSSDFSASKYGYGCEYFISWETLCFKYFLINSVDLLDWVICSPNINFLSIFLYNIDCILQHSN